MADATGSLSDLLRSLLERRGISTPEAIDAFLSPDWVRDTHVPTLLSAMDRAVTRILSAMAMNERIAVYADFDCDGIPGAAVLADTFAKIEYGNTEVYIPHRDREGYGFHESAIKALHERGVSLIITVDVGTTAVEQVAYAKSLGVDVIITDHHEIVGEVPDAFALINPKVVPPVSSGTGEYPFPNLCGAAVAWKLAAALLLEGRSRGIARFAAVPEGWEKWLLDLVAIATIADMVPLVGENRVLAHFGLMVLRKSPRPGLRALTTALRLSQRDLTEDDISFSFAPRINAASRMGDPELAFRLLTTKDASEAEVLAAHLEELNAQRKGVVGSMVREAKRRMRARFTDGERIIVLGDADWKPALLGLAANSLMEERGGVVCLWGRDASGNLKGSCRSDGSVSVVELFQAADEALEEYGGHAASGGFSVSHERVHMLHEALTAAAEGLAHPASVPRDERTAHDALIALSEVSPALLADISRLAPFGMGNPKPILRITNARVVRAKRFGKEHNHTEVMLACMRTGYAVRSFQFFRLPDDFTHVPAQGTAATVLATLERDTFRGRGSLALRLVDVLPAD